MKILKCSCGISPSTHLVTNDLLAGLYAYILPVKPRGHSKFEFKSAGGELVLLSYSSVFG